MADYIDRNILCQAYVHIEPVGLSDDEYQIVHDQIEHFIKHRGQFFLYSDIDSDVEFKSGSLKVYATIAGFLYLAIGQYGSFRSGLDYIATDVKRLSDSIVNESLFLTKSHHDKIIRVEARVGVIGSLKKVVDDIEFVEKNMGEMDVKRLAKKLHNTRISLARLLDNVKSENDVIFVQKNLLEIVNESLPKNPRTPPNKSSNRESDAIYREERRLFVELLEQKRKKS